jgi:glycosyltransferase involved in cell wall biosynthesis
VPCPPPLVTIAIPTLNRAHLLRLTLESALNQTYPNLEILVSDNASEDGTWDLLQGLVDKRLRTLRQATRLSMYEHWNKILSVARGDYFLLLSDDDVLRPQAIDKMMAAFQRDSSAGFVFCRGIIIDSEGRELIPGQNSKPLVTAEAMMLDFFRSKLDLWPCALLFRSSDIREGYPAEFPLGADAAVWMRVVARYGYARFVETPLVEYRVHRNTTTTVGVAPWQQENRKLAFLAIEQLQANGRGTASLFAQITKAVERLNIRISAGLLKNSSQSGFRVLFGFVKQSREFVSLYGMLVLSKSIIELTLPQKLRKYLVGLSRILKGQATFHSRSGEF